MEIELEQAIAQSAVEPVVANGVLSTAEAASGSTFAEKLIVGVYAFIGTSFLALLGIALKRRNKEQGTEDVVWGTANATIQRLQSELAALQKETDLVRTQRNEFEAAATRAENNSKIASEAAARASEAALRNEADLIKLRAGWEKSQRYIHILRTALAQHNLEIPVEPVA
jgi:hypothetical protein